MITRHVVPGVHQVAQASTNLYLIVEDDAVTLIDAGLPRMWDETTQALASVGRSWQDVQGIVLTHGHFDHLGIASRAVAEHRIPIWAHPADLRIVERPYRYRPGKPRLLYPFLHPRSIPHLASVVRAGGLRVQGVVPDHELVDGQTLDLPGRPVVVATPGHTDGHCVLHLPAKGIVFTGDALVTLDLYSGRTGPRVVGQAGTHDATTARRSLEIIGSIDATVVAPGHGAPWHGGAARAAALAQLEDIA